MAFPLKTLLVHWNYFLIFFVKTPNTLAPSESITTPKTPLKREPCKIKIVLF